MSQIKKYISGTGWKTFAETNTTNEASGITTEIVDDQNTPLTVLQVLRKHEDLLTKIQRNISWLALHGGGGNGTGTIGTTRKADATIYVGGLTNGANILVADNQDLVILLQDKTPSDAIWILNVTIDDTALDPTTISTTSKISYEDVLGPILSSGTARHNITVIISYEDTANNILKTEKSWIGTISSSNTSFTTTFLYDNETYYNVSNFLAGEQAFNVILNTSNIGTYRYNAVCKFKSSSFSYEKYDNDLIVLSTDNGSKTIKIYLKDIFSSVYNNSGMSNDAKIAAVTGVFQITLTISKIEVVNGNEMATDTVTNTTSFGLCGDSILFGIDGISYDTNDPTTLTLSKPSVTFTMIAYRPSGSDYKFKIDKIVDGAEKTTSYSEYSSNNLKYGVQYTFTNFFVGTEDTDKSIGIRVSIKDADVETYTDTLTCYVKVDSTGSSNFYTLKSSTVETKILDLDFISDPNVINSFASTALASNSNYVDIMTWASNTKSTGNFYTTRAYISNYNNSTKTTSDSSTNQPSLRISNETFIVFRDNFFTNSSVDENSTNPLKISSQYGYTFHIVFKSDSYIDDEHTIFAYGVPNSSGTLNAGFSIKSHGVYIKGQKVLDLTDNTISIVDIVFSNPAPASYSTLAATTWFGPKSIYSASGGYTDCFVKIYLDGILSYVLTDCPFVVDSGSMNSSSAKMYLGAVSDVNDTLNNYCNCNIYQLEVFTKVLDEMDILTMYINSSVKTSYKSTGNYDSSLLRTLRERNWCYTETNSQELKCDIIGSDSILNFDGLFTSKPNGSTEPDSNYGVPPVSTTDLANVELWETYKTQIPIPIVYVDAYGSDTWTKDNFMATGDQFNDISYTGPFYFWDTSRNNSLAVKATGVTFTIQGTSTKKDYIKNINITMSSRVSAGVSYEDILVVKADWLPEKTYTLKADVVDSSHSNNASIGKFINETFASGNTFFGFDSTAQENVEGSRLVLPTATIKHTIEGFPVLMFIRFAGLTSASFVGIYSFNLGRDAVRNMGFTTLKEIIYNGKSITINSSNSLAFYPDCQITESRTPSSYWIESFETTNCTNIEELDNHPTVGRTLDTFNTNDAVFWLTDSDMVDHQFECRYDAASTDPSSTKPSTISNFMSMITYVAGLPIEAVYKSTITDSTGGLEYSSDITGSYPAKTFVTSGDFDEDGRPAGSISTKSGEMVTLGNTSEETLSENVDKVIFDVDIARKYFCIALLFGLKDNFDKNISYRLWGKNNGNDEYYQGDIRLDFYDLDTALGINNTGETTVSPVMWIKRFHNVTVSDGSYQLVNETYDQKKDDIHTSTSTTVPESYSNKLWISLDTKLLNQEAGSTTFSSKYSEIWFTLRETLDTIAHTHKNPKTNLAYDTFADYFIDEYFSDQLGDCGSLIYNTDYKIKYLNILDTSNGSGTSTQGTKVPFGTTINTSQKLHGRRIEYTRRWLKEHIDFLDSMFYWRNRGSYGIMPSSNTTTGINLNTCVSRLAELYVSSVNLRLALRTNQPLIMRSSAGASGWVGSVLSPKSTSDNTYIYYKIAGAGINSSINNLKNITYIDFLSLGLTKVGVGACSYKCPGDTLFDVDYSQFEEISLNGTSFTEALDIGLFVSSHSNTVSKLKKIILTNITTGASIDLSLTESLQGVMYIDIHGSSKITALSLDDGIVLKLLSIYSSGISVLSLKNQVYIPLPNISGCTGLTKISLDTCTFTDSNGAELNLTSEYNNLTEVYIDNVKNLKTINIDGCEVLKSIQISNCPDLETITIDNLKYFESKDTGTTESKSAIKIRYNSALLTLNVRNTNIETILMAFTENNGVYTNDLRTLDITGTKISYITYVNFASTDPAYIRTYNDYVFEASSTYRTATTAPSKTEFKVLDLSIFNSLTDLNATNDKSLTHVRFRGSRTNPFILNRRFGSSSGMNATGLRRIFGHVKINCTYAFYNCSGFSLFGVIAPSTFKGRTITSGQQPTMWTLYETTPTASFDDFYDSTDIDNLNISYNDSFGGDPETMFYTAGTWLDTYYLLYMTAKHNASCTNKITHLYHTCYNYYAINSQRISGTLPRNMLLGMQHITNIWNFIYTNSIHITSPQDGADDGVLSPLTGLTYMGLFNSCNGTTTFDGKLFNRHSGYYAITEILRFLDSSHMRSSEGSGDYLDWPTTFFDKLPNLQSINQSWRSISVGDVSGIRIPHTVSYLSDAFTIYASGTSRFSTGNWDIDKLFLYDSNNECDLQTLQYSFLSASAFNKIKVYIRPSSFSKMKNLKYIGTNNVSYYGEVKHATSTASNMSGYWLTTCFGSREYLRRGVTRYIVKDSYTVGSTLSGTDKQYKTSDWTEFCTSLFLNQGINLITATGILEDAAIDENKGGLYTLTPDGSIPFTLTFPNALFSTNLNIQSIACFMHNFRGEIKLESGGFASMNNLRNVARLFKLDNARYGTAYYDTPLRNRHLNGIVSEIPYKLFFQGSSQATGRPRGVNGGSCPISFRLFKNYIYLMLVSTTAAGTLSDLWNKTGITQAKYDSLRDSITSLPEFTITSIADHESSRPVYTPAFVSDTPGESTNEVIGDTTMFNVLKPIYDSCTTEIWLNNIINIQSSSTDVTYITYTGNIENMCECFAGNYNIKYYTGSIDGVDQRPSDGYEPNAYYSPYDYKYVEGAGSFVPADKSEKTKDRSFMENGAESKDDSEIIYNPVVTALDSTTDYFSPVSIQGYSYILSSSFASYKRTAATEGLLNYLCAPDLLRYCKNEDTTNIDGLFMNTSKEIFSNWHGDHEYDIYAGRWVLCGTVSLEASMFGYYHTSLPDTTLTESAGIRGRIPENLLRPLSNITSVSRMFANCKQITGCTLTISGTTYRYLIPRDFFKYTPNITDLSFFMYGNFIPYKTTFAGVFTNYLSNVAGGLIVTGIFANCLWYNPNLISACSDNWLTVAPASGFTSDWTIAGTFTGCNMANINAAFAINGMWLYNSIYGKGTDEEFNATLELYETGINTRIGSINTYNGNTNLIGSSANTAINPSVIFGLNFTTSLVAKNSKPAYIYAVYERLTVSSESNQEYANTVTDPYTNIGS